MALLILSVPIGGAIVVYKQEQQQEEGGDSDINVLEDAAVVRKTAKATSR